MTADPGIVTSKGGHGRRLLGRLVLLPVARAGSSLVEMALVAPLLTLLVLGIGNLGQLMYMYIGVFNSAHAGATYGARDRARATDNAGMRLAALSDATNITGLTAAGSHFCECSTGSASSCLATDCAGSRMLVFVQVLTSAPYVPLVPYVALPGARTVNGRAVMRVVR